MTATMWSGKLNFITKQRKEYNLSEASESHPGELHARDVSLAPSPSWQEMGRGVVSDFSLQQVFSALHFLHHRIPQKFPGHFFTHQKKHQAVQGNDNSWAGSHLSWTQFLGKGMKLQRIWQFLLKNNKWTNAARKGMGLRWGSMLVQKEVSPICLCNVRHICENSSYPTYWSASPQGFLSAQPIPHRLHYWQCLSWGK